MIGVIKSHGEGERQEHKRDRGTNGGRPSRDQQGPGRRPRAARGGKGTRETAAEASTCRGAKRKAEDSGRWRVGENSR